MSNTYSYVRRLRAELKEGLEQYQRLAHPSEVEFLLRVLWDASELRGVGPEDGLASL